MQAIPLPWPSLIAWGVLIEQGARPQFTLACVSGLLCRSWPRGTNPGTLKQPRSSSALWCMITAPVRCALYSSSKARHHSAPCSLRLTLGHFSTFGAERRDLAESWIRASEKTSSTHSGKNARVAFWFRLDNASITTPDITHLRDAKLPPLSETLLIDVGT